MTLTGKQIRQSFLDYFASKEHTVVKSASLVPSNDPTLYFTNAGMVPFKNTFTGQELRPYHRATSSQKCMRVSGKHNDLENVGRTARHHTFFEMLGNFSFGDYFKTGAIGFAWEFLTEVVKLPKNKLWVTVYQDDDEAFDLWHKKIGLAKDRIVRLGDKDNFWSMGETGPCGPCSEIIFEQDIPCSLNNPDCRLGNCDCDKFLEVWNLVFMQFERHADGSKTPLPKPSIDTGMGLERLTALLQNKNSNYDCDLFSPIIKTIEALVQKKYTHDLTNENDVSIRVLADHIRSSVFLIGDGVLPSNEGRGYVLRRILRRAIRHGKLLGQTQPFFYKLVSVVLEEMGTAYPELSTHRDTIEKVIHAEEERFLETLDKGLKLLSEEISTHQKNKQKLLSGTVAFKLYDTFGFPLDLTEIIALEHGLTIDQDGFNTAMNEQKERARAGWKGSGEASLEKLHLELAGKHQTRFLGYDTLTADATVIALIREGQVVTEINEGACEVICDQTPCYAESGGQAGDRGTLQAQGVNANIVGTIKPAKNLFVHQVNVLSGPLKTGQKVTVLTDPALRQATARNHTATHIMHATLRKHLGTHVRQAGSLVTDQFLRFDFSHFEAIGPDALRAIENEVNEVILQDVPVTKQTLKYDEAVAQGALAFFGDKYDDVVRMIQVGSVSTELCGGTHLHHTSEIGSFRILSEGSIAAGVRRIEAITGFEALRLAQNDQGLINHLLEGLKATKEELPDRIEKLRSRIKEQDKEIQKLKQQALTGNTSEMASNTISINNTSVLFHHTEEAGDMRQMATTLVDKIKSGIVVVTHKQTDKAIVVVAVSPDLRQKYPANKVLEPLSVLLEGRGGGKADIAQAGGPRVSGLDQIKEAIEKVLL